MRWVILFFVSSVAWAYVPPSEFMVRKFSNKRIRYNNFWVSTKIIEVSDERPTGTELTEITVADFDKGRMYVRIYEDSEELYTIVRTVTKKPERDFDPRRLNRNIEIETNTSSPNFLSLGGTLLFDADYNKISQALKARKIPVQVEEDLIRLKDEKERREAEMTWVMRWAEKLSWIIGPKPTTPEGAEKPDPSLWFVKDAFYPQRLIWDASHTGRTELSFEDYRFARGYAFPGRVIQKIDGVAVLHDEVRKIAVNADLAKYEPPTKTGYTEKGESAGSDVKKIIMNFVTTLR